MIKLGKLFNTDVFLHWSVAIIIFIATSNAYNVMSLYSPNKTGALIGSFIYTLGLIFSVVAHEFGHILVGRRVGIGFSKITIHGLGGAAHMEGIIPSPKAEALMALAGPTVSLALCGVFALITFVWSKLFYSPTDVVGMVLAFTAFTNFALMAFNLLPIGILDGGRVLRAGLWAYTKNFIKATSINTIIGKIFGAGFVAMGFFMMFGFEFPFFGKGIQAGIWQIIMGVLIIGATDYEMKHYKRQMEKEGY